MAAAFFADAFFAVPSGSQLPFSKGLLPGVGSYPGQQREPDFLLDDFFALFAGAFLVAI